MSQISALYIHPVGAGRRREAEGQAVADILARDDFMHTVSRLCDRRLSGSVLVDHDRCGRPVASDDSGELPVYLSVSHSRQLAVLAVSGQPVGVDAEEMRPQLLRVESRFAAEGEVDGLLPFVVDRLSALLLIWTAKEAVFKAYHAFCAQRHCSPCSVSLADIRLSAVDCQGMTSAARVAAGCPDAGVCSLPDVIAEIYDCHFDVAYGRVADTVIAVATVSSEKCEWAGKSCDYLH